MKPVHERNQECLPPKKRDLPVDNNSNTSTNNSHSSSISSSFGSAGGGGGGGGGEDAPSSQSSGVSGEGSGEWVRAQQSMHYGVECAEGLVGLPVDQYSMLYKVALPAGTYSPTNLHPVLSHISPAYTVPSPVLQHTSVPYPPLCYTHIPHSSLQEFPLYGYAMPPGFVPSPLMPPQSAISQPHSVSHLVPYPSVIQEGVGSSQQQVSTHAYTKMGVPLVQTATQAQLGTVGMLPAGELSPRALYYNPTIRGVQPQRDLHSSSMEQEREVNGGDREHGGRESHQDVVYLARSTQLLQATAPEPQQDKSLKSRRPEGRMSPGQRSTPDTDLEVQQVVGRLASPIHGMSRKEAAHVPLNLSQSSQRGRETQGEVRTPYASNQAESRAQTQQYIQQGHAVILANGQPVLVPLDYHHHQQQQQQHFQSNDVASAAIAASPAAYTKAMDAGACLPDRAVVDLPPQQGQQPSQQPPGTFSQAPLLAPSGPSHFMKGAIIQLATGELKRVEDLQTQDFVRSAEASGGLKIDSSMVVDIRASQQRPGLVALHFNVGEQQSKVTIDVPPEHPFFVFGQGWSSCSPEQTAQLYGLTCHHLQVGDVCVSVTMHQQAAPQQKPPQQVQARTPTKVNSTSGAPPQPMGPPAPQHTPRPQSQLKMERIHRERDRDKEEPMQVGGSRHVDMLPKPNRTSAEHNRSQSNYYLHTEGHAPPGTGAGASSVGASQRRWSAPGFQRYSFKNEDGGSLASAATSGSSRLSFIPQEVKLSIEGRSNAGK
ncbi:ataxin-1-like [Carassius auratus]|uniref:Ataxin-1-like n=1 Tax=Carassius auratus TaxID=7957 RepID=A0A6P6PVI8_CARAU|nr:ataxin-1-like [Carassius auratus]